MPVHIEWLSDATFPLFREFAERVWDRPRDDAFYCWRYREAPRHRILVAHQDGRCLATASVFERPYSFAGRQVDCLETCDWFCLPELRGSGLGIRVMRMLMGLGAPIIALGGSDDTLTLLPRLGFQTVAPGHHFTLPFSGAAVRSIPRDGFRARATAAVVAQVLDVVAPVALLTRRSHELAVECVASSAGAPFTQPGVTDEEEAAICPIPCPEHLAWLTSAKTRAGEFFSFRASMAGDCIASVIARVYTQHHVKMASLLDVRWSLAGRERLGDLLRVVTDELRTRGAESIVAASTCELLSGALRANAFRRRGPAPALVFPAGQSIPAGPVRLSVMRGDGGLFPLPTAADATL